MESTSVISSMNVNFDNVISTTPQDCGKRLLGTFRGPYSAVMHSLVRYDRSKVSGSNMTLSTIIHVKIHSVVPIQAGEQRDTPQSRYH